MKEIREIIAEFERRPTEPLALATLVRAKGSSYRRPGARMLIAPDGTTVGVLSGGCLEEEVATHAEKVIATGAPRLLRFDTRLRYGCNGAIEVFVEKLAPEFLRRIAFSLRQRQASEVVTEYENSDSLGSRVLEAEENVPGNAFRQTITPPLQLLLIGHGPDSAALRSFATTLGWDLIEVAEVAGLAHELDDWTAAIVKTHNYGRDYAALASLLPLGLRYLALIGPRLRRDQLLHALLDEGIVKRSELFAPAGLDLGAESPEEIALAVASEIQATFARVNPGSLRDRKRAIHLLPDLSAV